MAQSPCKCHRRPWCLHNDPCVGPWSSYCLVGYLTAWLWQPYSHPTALLFEHWVIAFNLSMLKVLPIARCCVQSHSLYWWCHCIASAFCIFPGCCRIVPEITVRTLLLCFSGLLWFVQLSIELYHIWRLNGLPVPSVLQTFTALLKSDKNLNQLKLKINNALWKQ